MEKPTEVNPPRSPKDRRPNDRPFHIEECCSSCDSVLVYADLLRGKTDWAEIMFDGFACPQCQDGTYLDWTPKQLSRLDESIHQAKDKNNCLTIKPGEEISYQRLYEAIIGQTIPLSESRDDLEPEE
jgi:hypothetical protein